MNKKIITLLICIILTFAIIPLIEAASVNSTEKVQQKNVAYEKFVETSYTTDWWPMFQHDPANTGKSTSNTPDMNNIREIWNYRIDCCIETSPAVVGDRIYITSNGGSFGEILCLDIDTGAKIWIYHADDAIFGSSPAVVNGRLYTGLFNGKVLCLNIETGMKSWCVKLDSGILIDNSPVVVDGKIYIGSGGTPTNPNKGKIYCLNAENGSLIWDYSTGHYVSSPAVANGKVYFCSNGKICCMYAENGSYLWDYPTYSSSLTSPAVSNGKAYTSGISDGKLYCIDAENGSYLWDYSTEADYHIYSTPAIAYNKIYFTAYCPSVYKPGKIFCIDAESGTHNWEYSTEQGSNDFHCQVSIADNKVFTSEWKGGNDHEQARIHCFNAFNGDLIWRHSINVFYFNHVMGSVVIADGKLFFGSVEKREDITTCGKIYCYGNTDPNAPNVPRINGPTSGKAGTTYEYTISSLDPQKDDIYYKIDWGDGTDSFWSGPHISERTIRALHIWEEKGDYTIKVKAKDKNGFESGWGYLSVTMPKQKSMTTPIFEKLLKQVLNSFPVLQQFLQHFLKPIIEQIMLEDVNKDAALNPDKSAEGNVEPVEPITIDPIEPIEPEEQIDPIDETENEGNVDDQDNQDQDQDSNQEQQEQNQDQEGQNSEEQQNDNPDDDPQSNPADVPNDGGEGIYTLTININGGGTVSASPEKDLYEEGEMVTLTANPNSGRVFDHWEGDVTSDQQDDNPLTITMDSDKTVTAYFALSSPMM